MDKMSSEASCACDVSACLRRCRCHTHVDGSPARNVDHKCWVVRFKHFLRRPRHNENDHNQSVETPKETPKKPKAAPKRFGI